VRLAYPFGIHAKRASALQALVSPGIDLRVLRVKHRLLTMLLVCLEVFPLTILIWADVRNPIVSRPYFR
jgi:hypothetical protein